MRAKMPLEGRRRAVVIGVIEILVLLVAYRIVAALVAGTDAVSALLAGGLHAPAWKTVLTLAFLSMRIIMVLFLPGFILVRIANVLLAPRSSAAGRLEFPSGV